LEEIQEDNAMTRSVEELRRESERNRAQLATTVDRVREQITDTAEDIRHKVSPQHVKSEVSDFISTKASSWVDSLKQHARENPMQAIAAGTAIAMPILRLARGFPLPLLMIGAGLALSSKTVRERTLEAAAPAANKASEMMGDAMERAQSLQGDAREAVSSAWNQATGVANKAQDAAAGAADDIGDRAAQVTGTVADKLRAGIDAASGMASEAMNSASATVTDAARVAPEKPRRVIGDNAALIGGLGIAIGAIIAASLPATRAEASVLGEASDGMKRAASEAAGTGFEAAKDAVVSVADAALPTPISEDTPAGSPKT
jgi:hypothetical protein